MDEKALLKITVERSLYANRVIQSRDVLKVLNGRIPRTSEVYKGFAFIRVWMARGYLVKVKKDDYQLTELGAAWCGAARVANT